MPSLKEVKNRIASVGSTRKITSAMKMVASSKLHRAQQTIESMRPYEAQLSRIMSALHSDECSEGVSTPYAEVREVKRVALVCLTSNSSLCGGFNANVIKELKRSIAKVREDGGEVVRVYAIGKKGAEAAAKMGMPCAADYSALLDHPAYLPAATLAQELMDGFRTGDLDRVELLYHHFKSAGTQVLTREALLPLTLSASTKPSGQGEAEHTAGNAHAAGHATLALDYLIEPSRRVLVEKLVPKALKLKLYTAVLDSLASEHAARVIAMQVATDNADDLLRELTLTYNKTRQAAITTELLDIVGGSMR